MSVESNNSLSNLEDSQRKVVETYRSISRWVVSTFGAVAGALLVGVQLSSLGKLHGSHLDWALASVAVLFLAILAVIGAAVRVLTPVRVIYDGFGAPEFKALRKAVKHDKALLGGRAASLDELAREYDAAETRQKEAHEAHERTQSEATKKSLEEAEENTNAWDEPVMEMVWLGRSLHTRRVFKQSMAITLLAILLAAAAATSFAYQSSMPTKEGKEPQNHPSKVHVSVNEPKTCVDLYLALDSLADDEPHIGSHWPTSSLGAQDHACGFHNVHELARFLSFLAHH
jgi:hypothetical protein